MDVEALWKQFASERTDAARNRLAEYYLYLVEHQARLVWRRLPEASGLSVDDLVSEGVFGLFQAIESYDPQRRVKFATYAPQRIRGAILDGLRSIDWLPRLERQREKRGEVVPVAIGSFDGIVDQDEEGHTLEKRDLLEDRRAPSPDARQRVVDFWRDVCCGLSKQERLVLLLYYREGLTMRTISEHVGLSESRVSQIHSALQRRFGASAQRSAEEPAGMASDVEESEQQGNVMDAPEPTPHESRQSLVALLRQTSLADVREQISELEAELRALRVVEQALAARDGQSDAPSDRPEPRTHRRRPGKSAKRIREFLEKNGPATFGEIVEGAEIPTGSMSAALRGAGAVKENGLWRLKK